MVHAGYFRLSEGIVTPVFCSVDTWILSSNLIIELNREILFVNYLYKTTIFSMLFQRTVIFTTYFAKI